jgi:hypothetical protein
MLLPQRAQSRPLLSHPTKPPHYFTLVTPTGSKSPPTDHVDECPGDPLPNTTYYVYIYIAMALNTLYHIRPGTLCQIFRVMNTVMVNHLHTGSNSAHSTRGSGATPNANSYILIRLLSRLGDIAILILFSATVGGLAACVHNHFTIMIGCTQGPNIFQYCGAELVAQLQFLVAHPAGVSHCFYGNKACPSPGRHLW